MKRVQLSELGAIAEDVRKGETVQVIDGERQVGVLKPPRTDEEILDEMERKGLIDRRGRKPLPDWFFAETPVKVDDSGINQVLLDRQKNDW